MKNQHRSPYTRFMVAPLSCIIFSLNALPAASQEATKALVRMYVAQDFCGLDAPEVLVKDLAPRSAAETGMTSDQLLDALAKASNNMGQQFAQDRTLGQFCRDIGKVYFEVRSR
jgi:hypothetical protein